MITDAELLKLVMDKYPEQDTAFIIEQFSVFKAGVIQANGKLSAGGTDSEAHLPETGEPSPEAVEETPTVAPKKKFTKRHLVVRPEEAIGDDAAKCCLCGRAFQNLTAKHIQSHGLTVEEYKKLCGYAQGKKLISANLLNKLQANVQKAQVSREAQRIKAKQE